MKWLTFFFLLFIVLIIVLADLGQLGILGAINKIPFGDKAGHFILYGILTLLIDLTLFRSLPFQNPRRMTVISGLILALLIGVEELSQQFFASRTVSFQDLFAGYLGVIFFSWLALKINKS